MSVDLSAYQSDFSLRHKLLRVLWGIVWAVLYRTSPVPLHRWRCLLLRMFGARIGKGVHPYPTARIWAPWNLAMDDHSCLAEAVICYCVDKIRIGAHTTVSQYTFLCTASHDHEDPSLPLITAPIAIGAGVWIMADAYVAPGVVIGDGAVVGVRSSVFRDVEPWTVVVGTPARFFKRRVLRHTPMRDGAVQDAAGRDLVWRDRAARDAT